MYWPNSFRAVSSCSWWCLLYFIHPVAYNHSDEPDEVTVVKKALAEHLDMDSKITLGVLCDQIVPVQEPMEPEEKATRDRLRTLVLAFIAGEARRAIVERHASQAGSVQEQLIINGLFKVTVLVLIISVRVLTYPTLDLVRFKFCLGCPQDCVRYFAALTVIQGSLYSSWCRALADPTPTGRVFRQTRFATGKVQHRALVL